MLNFNQWLKENEHLKHYTTAGLGFKLNDKLKSGEKLTDEEKAHHEGLSSYIKANRHNGPMKTLYRGQGEHPGKTYHSKGYLSTSDAIGSALAYAENHQGMTGEGHLLHVRVGRGDAIANIDHHSQYQGEGEHLIHHGATIHFQKHEVDEDGIHHHYGYLKHDGT